MIPTLIKILKTDEPYIALEALFSMAATQDNFKVVMINENISPILIKFLMHPEQ